MTQYRIVELRPDVFSVEEYKGIAWFLPWVKDWVAVREVLVPQFSEYSPDRVAEFTRDGAEQYVAVQEAADELVRVRENPPKGYPRVIDGED